MALNFPCKIYQILENESPDIVRWHSSNIAFRIIDHDRFEKEIIPKYFRHNQLSSLQRQLNLYGFKCISRGDDKGAFFHPKFKRGEWEAVKKITRYINPKKGDIGCDRACDRMTSSNGKLVKKEKSMGDSQSDPTSSAALSVYPAVSLPSSYLSRKTEVIYKTPSTLSSTYPKTVTSVPFKAPVKPQVASSTTPIPTVAVNQPMKVPTIPSTTTFPVSKVSYPYPTLSINSEKVKSEATDEENKAVITNPSMISHSSSATDSQSSMLYDMYDPFNNTHLFSNTSDNLIDHDYNLEAEMNLLYDVTSDSSSANSSANPQGFYYPQNHHAHQQSYYYPQNSQAMMPMNYNNQSEFFYPYPQQPKQTCDASCNTDLTISDFDNEFILVKKE